MRPADTLSHVLALAARTGDKNGSHPNWVDIATLLIAIAALLASSFVAITVARIGQKSAESTTRLANALQEQTEYATGLHKERVTAYQKLYKLLEPLAHDGRPPPTADSCHGISRAMTAWYFDEGGILLSEELRDEFFDLRHRLAIYQDGDTSIRSSEEIRREMEDSFEDAKNAFPLRRHASALRTALTAEVFSRQGARDGHTPRTQG